MRRVLGAAALALATGAVASPAGRGFTLAQVLSAPFVGELTASPVGDRVAWVANERGARNVWIAEGPAFEGRRLTAYTADDGQELGGLAWAPDGQAIAFVRGGGPNRRGEIPNPTSDPAGAEQRVLLVSVSGGSPLELGEGSGPVVSPRGDRVVFRRGGQVLSVPIGGGDEELLFHARGRAEDLRFSPDGRRLAFVSDRGSHSFVGVYDLDAKRLAYLAPGTDRDVAPCWSPDGRRLAYLRLPSRPDRIPFVPDRSGPPWSVRVADVASGGVRTVFRAPTGRGSVFRGLASDAQLQWTRDDRIVFPWEGDGWLHLYSVPAAGGEPTALTLGEFEVEEAAPAPGGSDVLFTANKDDIDRRHVWRVAVAGGPPVAVTAGEGLEWTPVATSGSLLVIRSDARRPHGPALVTRAGLRDVAPQAVPADFPESALVVPEPVVFSAADGLRIHAQLFLPPDLAAGERRPAVVFFHGGSRRQMLLGWHYREYYHDAYAMNQYLASRGYVVLSVNYRSGIGYGLDFREAEGYGAAGASEFGDVLGAGLYLRSRSDVDPDRIGLWGGSYGGYLTALGLARASSLFRAGVDIHGVHDWNVVIANFVPGYDPAKNAERARLAFESSPMASVEQWRSPVLLIHGDDDRNVPFSETVDLVAALRRQRVPFETLVFPDEIHELLVHADWLRAYAAAADFLDRHLKEGGSAAKGER
jgi:dipeptidyl aminopeptidase/acylaminoacyl peptidase